MQQESAPELDVLLLLGPFQMRGSYARSLSLIERLPSQRIQLKLAASDRVPLPRSREAEFELRVSQYLTWPFLDRIAKRFLAADLSDDPPDLIDVQQRMLHPIGSWLARTLKRPYVVTVHDYLRDRERFCIDPEWCRRVVAVSESVRSELLERTNLPEEMVVVIPSGVQPPPETDLSEILPSGRCPVIGTAGPLEVGKGLQHFLSAATIVLKKFPDAMFVIAGSGPEERSLRRMAIDLKLGPSLTILPNLRDFGPALRAMDIFVLPAIKQGLGSTMLDAMARGLPVIGTESGGVYSLIVEGVTGRFARPSDAESLADRIQELLANPEQARSYGRAARQRVLDHFHVDQLVRQTASLYRQCVPKETAESRKLRK